MRSSTDNVVSVGGIESAGDVRDTRPGYGVVSAIEIDTSVFRNSRSAATGKIIPAGSTILGASLYVRNASGGGQMNVGTSADADAFIDAQTWPNSSNNVTESFNLAISSEKLDNDTEIYVGTATNEAALAGTLVIQYAQFD